MKQKKNTKYRRNVGRIIINTFIGIFGIVVFLLIISFGIMQTSTFRSWLKNKVISEVNQSINGTVNISKIEGTILTSLYLKNISVSTGRDTLLKAEKIGVNINPVRLLIGQIYVGNLLLLNADIVLNESSPDNWNYENLTKKDTVLNNKIKSNTDKSEFPFKLVLKNIDIKNLSFVKKTLKYQNSNAKYDIMNFDDIKINNFNLNASIAADINQRKFMLVVKSMSASPNLKYFNLKQFNGLFEINKNYVQVENLKILTDSSAVNLSARMDSLNLFSNFNLKDFKNYPINCSLSANPFNFSDITSFISATDILNGTINVNLEGNGKFGNMNIKKLSADFLGTHLELTGNMKNLDNPSKLFLDAKIVNSSAEYEDVLRLLPTLDLPQFKNFRLSNFNTTFKGEPLNFRVVGNANVDSGKIKFDTYLNLEQKEMAYNAKLTTANLDVSPIINSHTLLNGKIKIKGKGTDPANLKTKFDIYLHNSLFGNGIIDSVHIKANSLANIIDINLNGEINKSISKLSGKLDFSDRKNPSYDFNGTLKKLNLQPFTQNEELKSSLNFNFYAKGKYLDIDKTIGIFSLDLDSSTFNGNNLYGSTIKLELKRDSLARLISLSSNFADIYVNGNFKITDLTNLLSYQSKIISKIIEEKISDFNPKSDRTIKVAFPDSISADVNKKINMDYSLNFKDFSIIQILFNNDKFSVKGTIQGSVQNDSTHFEISSELKLDRLVQVKNDDLVFFSGIDADLNISRANQVNSFKNIIGALTFTGQRLYTGNDFRNINLDLTFNDSLLFYDGSADLSENLSTLIGGKMELRKPRLKIAIDTLLVDYKKIPWQNKGQMVLNVRNDSLIFKDFNLYLQNTSLNVGGFISDSLQNITLSLNKLHSNIINYYLTGSSSDSLKSFVDLVGHIKGNSKNPVIDLRMRTNEIKINNYKYGSLLGSLNYSNKNINTNLQYISKTGSNAPLLSLKGNIPIDLTFESVENRVPADKKIDLHLKSNNFNLNALGNILPLFVNQKGNIKTDITATGNVKNPIFNGELSISNGQAKFRETNLVYSFNGKAIVDSGIVSIQNFNIANAGNSKYKGKMSVSGDINLSSQKLNSMAIDMAGNLASLSAKTKETNPFLFGDLFVKTNGPLRLTYSDETSRYSINGDVKLENVDLTYTSSQSGFVAGHNGFNYIYVIDSSKIDSHELYFMNLLKNIQNKNKDLSTTGNEDSFDYHIKVTTGNDAVFTINLAKELGQKLTANLNGSIVIDKEKGQSNAQGSFQLLEGSRLDFFKTLNATGEIRFEQNLLDPYIDVTASYISDYVSPNDPFGKSEEVAVKIKLSDPLSKLGEKLTLNEENFAVYVGRKNIDSNIPNTNYDVADALAFILVGKFKNDLTSNSTANGSQTNATSSAASFVISPLLTSILNSALGGGVIEDIQIGQAGQYYRVGISGKVQNFRYKIGGTSQVLSDIAKANILVQYFFNNDISIRVERRYPIIYSEGTDERVNELGLRYKFEF